MATVGSSVFRLRIRGRDDAPADLPVHRWLDDHALDLLEGPETTFWGPEPTNWVRGILRWAEQDAQSEDAEVAFWAHAIPELLRDLQGELDAIDGEEGGLYSGGLLSFELA